MSNNNNGTAGRHSPVPVSDLRKNATKSLIRSEKELARQHYQWNFWSQIYFAFFFVFVFVLFHFLLSYYFRIYSAIARYLKLYKFVDKDISKHTQVEMGIETTHAKHK